MWSETEAGTAICGGQWPHYILCKPWINSIYGIVHVQTPNFPVSSNQEIYLWNGVTQWDNQALLQPVLTYAAAGSPCATSGQWSVPLWYIEPTGQIAHEYCGIAGFSGGSYVNLNTYVFDNNCNVNTGQNCNWAIAAWINGFGSHTQYFTSSTGPGDYTFPDSAGNPGVVPGPEIKYQRAVLETYKGSANEADCNQLPTGNGIGTVEWSSTAMWQPVTSPTDYHQTGPSSYTDGTDGGKGCGYFFNATTESTSYVQMGWN